MLVTYELMQKIGTLELSAWNRYFCLLVRYYMLLIFAHDLSHLQTWYTEIVEIEPAVTHLSNISKDFHLRVWKIKFFNRKLMIFNVSCGSVINNRYREIVRFYGYFKRFKVESYPFAPLMMNSLTRKN